MNRLLRGCLLLLSRPSEGIHTILTYPPRLGSLLLFLGMVGFLRGFLEALWLLGIQYRPGMLFQLAQEPGRYLFEGQLFIAANVMTAYLRWAMYTFLFLAVARWFGQRVSFQGIRNLTGLLLALYLVPVLLNSLYLLLPLPVIQFTVADVYQPILGLGTLGATIWFAWISFWIFRKACRLSPWESFLAAAFIPLLDRVLFVGGAAVVFQFRQLAWLPVTTRMGLVTAGFLLVSLLATPLILWIGRRLDKEPSR